MSIKILDQNTINQIAAGEVIDRPSSVVKELTENAIDAGASVITIEIKDGGTSLIRITDNGCGIDKEDIKIAFLRHSTSKIKDAMDLLTVSSLGFRGEALSSIAAVSMVELMTKPENQLMGVRYIIEGGKELSMEEIGIPNGTTFVIRNLFFNTPARRKFLKSFQTEAGYIYDIIERIALSHPEISIRFISNCQTKLHTPGNGNIKDTIYSIFGREITSNIIEISNENEFMKIHGYIGKPLISRGNRSYEDYFINGRYIKNSIINKAIEEAYKNYIMQHKYPFTVMYLDIDKELLDVNVHPAKMELRFRNGEAIYPFLVSSISDVLSGKQLIPKISFTDEKEEKREINKKPAEAFEINRNNIFNENTKYIYKEDERKINLLPVENEEKKNDIHEINDTQSKTEYEKGQATLFDDILLSKAARKKHILVGQIFDTYWIVQYGDSMYIIDQHAAHEKVLYEKFMKHIKNKNVISQQINPPMIINLSMSEEEILKKYMDIFKETGYEIEHFGGNDYCIRAIPHDLLNIDKKELFMEILDTLNTDSGRGSFDMILEKVASMSCKAAVKGNNRLSVNEANELIDELLSLDNPYNCPHGRPTIIDISKTELERKFKRIV